MMLADGVRNSLLARAVERYVTPEMSFLDVGTGTGIWAILAAKLGAKRVVAVEIEECLIPIIYKHAQENGVADRVEIIHGRSDDVEIKGKFNVIVSELFGGDAFGPESVNSFIDIRTRFLAPGGVLIPQKLTMFAVPAHIDASINDIPAGVSIKNDFLKTLRLNYPQNISRAEKGQIKFLAEPQKMVELDFRTIQEPPDLAKLSASWPLDDISEANAIATFNRSTFANDIIMDSPDSQSWGIGTYGFIPFEAKGGKLQLSLTIDQQNSSWTLTVPDEPNLRPQTYSPIFGFTRMRMAQQATPYVKSKTARTK